MKKERRLARMPRERSKAMAKVTIRYPEHSAKERKRLLRELKERFDINESLESLITEMYAFESKYGMSTVEFYARFVAGKMGDSRDFIKWAGTFDDYQYMIRTYFQHRREAA
jgi:hypothetical protein